MVLLKLGPLGRYDDKKHWEETGRGKISHIFVTSCGSFLCTIHSVWICGKWRSGHVQKVRLIQRTEEDQSTRILRLNHESEFVTGISGEKTCYSNICSLTFHTNERKHEAFHADFDYSRSERFEFLAEIDDGREFGGFFGSYNCVGELSSIGLYLEPILVHSPKC